MTSRSASQTKPKGRADRARPRSAAESAALAPQPIPAHAAALEEARRAGLFDGDKTEHVSFRAPPALVEAAKREAGLSSTTELGMLALAMLARPDPLAAFFRRTEGRLGPEHDLEY
ncbi:hypothetical protein [Methylobacterium trifolii]|uniref:Uncharacterized protein n=1 Tax=Methylobacterium trifolii TaxID=1003092 RepID=A0ABQ4TTQ3_9HYPH|nr:hypothetical protein [Methylobacterium trifolii]GJE58284.1 hypothetical protein MPOCJGCO_0363 [Methylobacterium trifolii]